MTYLEINTLLNWTRSPVGIVKTLLEFAKRFDGEYLYFNKEKEEFYKVKKQTVLDHIKNIEKNNYIKPFIDEKRTYSLSKNDTYISIGLDWDYSDYEKLFFLKKEKKFKFIGCVYDLIPVNYPHLVVNDYFSKIFFHHLVNLLYLADGIFCISDFTKKELENFIKDNYIDTEAKIKTIYLGDNIHKNSKKVLRPHNENNFIMYVSTVEIRKNHLLLLKAYKELLNEINLPDLIFVGMRGWGVDDVYDFYEKNPQLHNKVFFYEDVDDEELAYLYKTVKYTLFPSEVEGWGLASRESMAFGKPVLISEAEALKEATQDLMLNLPNDKDYWIEAVKLMENKDVYNFFVNEIKEKFRLRSWDEFYLEFREFINECS
ncbi:glycosyltransferase [Caminibacter sp.]